MSKMLNETEPQSPALETSRAEQPWDALPNKDLYTHFNVQRDAGLNQEEVDHRLSRFGTNRLREAKQESLWRVFLEEIREPMILLLLTHKRCQGCQTVKQFPQVGNCLARRSIYEFRSRTFQSPSQSAPGASLDLAVKWS